MSRFNKRNGLIILIVPYSITMDMNDFYTVDNRH